jgi:hypothetical protein
MKKTISLLSLFLFVVPALAKELPKTIPAGVLEAASQARTEDYASRERVFVLPPEARATQSYGFDTLSFAPPGDDDQPKTAQLQ